MTLAPAITAFGNTNPTSYFRLVPHQEAPTNICWGDRNRPVLVRVPAPRVDVEERHVRHSQRNSAAVRRCDARQSKPSRYARPARRTYTNFLRLLAVAVRYGLEMPDALEVSDNYYVDIDIHKPENALRCNALPTLPANCAESADRPKRYRTHFEAEGVFPPESIDATIASLQSFDTAEAKEALNNPEIMAKFVKAYFSLRISPEANFQNCGCV